MASGVEGSEKLEYKKWVFKVSIHCEGCKKKVKKVLQGVEGIYSIDIESKQNKATVIGNVEAEAIIRRLLKHGKHAELWPENKVNNPVSSPTAGGDAEAKGNEKAAATVAETEAKPANSEKSPQASEGTEETAVKTAEAPAPTTDVKPTDDIGVEAQKASSSDDPGKLKQNNEVMSEASEKDAVKAVEELKKEQSVKNRGDKTAISVEPTKQSASRPTPPYVSPAFPSQVYTMSYNTAYPQTSYSFYAMRPLAMRSDDIYSVHAPPAFYSPEYYPPETYYGSMELPPATSTGTYDIFNEENPNACSVM